MERFSGETADEEFTGLAEYQAEYAFRRKGENDVAELEMFLQSKQNAKEVHLYPGDFCSPSFIFPSANNPRVEAQNGAFVMAPILTTLGTPVDFRSNEKGLEGTQFFNEESVAIIEADAKQDILTELATLGVDDGTVFCDVSHKISAIVKKANNNH